MTVSERVTMTSCVFYSNLLSIMYGFRYNHVFLNTGNDVMVISPLWGAVQSF